MIGDAIHTTSSATLLAQAQVRSTEVEAAWLSEHRLVVVGRDERDPHDRAGRDRLPVPRDLVPKLAIFVHDDAVAAHELGERRADERGVGPDGREHVRMVEQDRDEVGQAAVRRLAAGDHHQGDE